MKQTLIVSIIAFLFTGLAAAENLQRPVNYKLSCTDLRNFGRDNITMHKDTYTVTAKLDSADSLFSDEFSEARIGMMNYRDNDVHSLRIDESKDVVVLASKRFGVFRLIVEKTQTMTPDEPAESRKWYKGRIEYLNLDYGSSGIACTIQKHRI